MYIEGWGEEDGVATCCRVEISRREKSFSPTASLEGEGQGEGEVNGIVNEDTQTHNKKERTGAEIRVLIVTLIASTIGVPTTVSIGLGFSDVTLY